MKSLCFLHVADLHLDAAFSAVAHDDKEELAKRMQDAPFEALQNLLRLCRTLLPHFLIFSGDVYNKEEGSLRARFALRDAFLELEEMNIPVYYAHGNHDPLDEARKEFTSIEWPKNVHSFGENWEYFSFPSQEKAYEDGDKHQELARIYGISHVNKQESRNLTSSLKVEPALCVHIGVLHTSLMGSQSKSKIKYNYAPCSIVDLQEKNMHYWALGHVHIPHIVAENPLVAYSGAIQGLDITEEGAHGCFFVQFKSIDNGYISNPEYSFHSLAPVEWHILDIELEPKKDGNALESIIEIKNIIAKYIAAYIEGLTLGTECTDLIFRIRLYGRSNLANDLNESDVQNDLCQNLQKLKIVPRIFIKDIQSFVRPIFDFESALDRDDILGEILRVTQELRTNKGLLIQTEKDVSESLKSKISRYTININEKNKNDVSKTENVIGKLEELTYKAEDICVEAFEPQ